MTWDISWELSEKGDQKQKEKEKKYLTTTVKHSSVKKDPKHHGCLSGEAAIQPILSSALSLSDFLEVISFL